MGKIIDLTGQKFGCLEVKGRQGHCRKEVGWLCECECGVKTVVGGYDLRSGHTKSCGCFAQSNRSKMGAKNIIANGSTAKAIENRKRQGSKNGGKTRAYVSRRNAIKRREDGLSIRRIAKELSVEEAAILIGVSASFLSQVECGVKKFGAKCNHRSARAIYGDLCKFGKVGGCKKIRHCLVCNKLFEGGGKADRRGNSSTSGKTFDICSDECLQRWYAGERFKAPLPAPLMDAPKPPKERKRDREKAAIAAVVKENKARSS